jgi:DNA-binding CsgD family transcriptional regulator
MLRRPLGGDGGQGVVNGVDAASVGTVVIAHEHRLVAEVLASALTVNGLDARVHDGAPMDAQDVLVRQEGVPDPGTDREVVIDAARGISTYHSIEQLVAALRAPRVGVSRPELQPAAPVPALLGLTEREREVLALIARGDGNDAVGAALGISPHTVRTHVQNLLGKLDVDTRLAAASLARRHGLVAAVRP